VWPLGCGIGYHQAVAGGCNSREEEDHSKLETRPFTVSGK